MFLKIIKNKSFWFFIINLLGFLSSLYNIFFTTELREIDVFCAVICGVCSLLFLGFLLDDIKENKVIREREYKRVYSEVDPYGEENWEE